MKTEHLRLWTFCVLNNFLLSRPVTSMKSYQCSDVIWQQACVRNKWTVLELLLDTGEWLKKLDAIRSQKLEPATPILSICNSVFTNQVIFSIIFEHFSPWKWKHCSICICIDSMVITNWRSKCYRNSRNTFFWGQFPVFDDWFVRLIWYSNFVEKLF